MTGRRSVIGRPISVGMMFRMRPAIGVKRRMRRSLESITIAMLTLASRLFRSSLVLAEFEVAVLQLLVDRGQLLIGRLHFLFGGLQLLVDALQLLVAGEDLLVGRLQFLVGRALFLDDRLQVLAGCDQFLLHLLHLPQLGALAAALFRGRPPGLRSAGTSTR